MSGCGIQERLIGLPVGPELVDALVGLGPVERQTVDNSGVREVWPDATEQVIVAQAWQKVVAWAEAQLNNAVRQIVGHRVDPTDEDWGREEVAAGLRWSNRAAADRIDVARALAGRLFRTGQQLAEGRISYRHAAEIVQHLEPLDDELAAEVEARLLGAAGTKTSAQLGRLARKEVMKADPAGADERHRRARRRRRVEFTALEDAMAELRALLPAADAARIRTALDRIAGRSRAKGDDRTLDARRADALVALAELGILTADGELPLPPELATDPDATPEPPATGDTTATPAATATAERTATEQTATDDPRNSDDLEPDRGTRLPDRCQDLIRAVLSRTRAAAPRVALVAPLSTVLGAAQLPGDLTGYGPVPPGVVRELAATGRWEKWLTDRRGVVTDLGRSTYRPTAALADLIRATYPTCMFPGCSQPSYRCDLDHNVRRIDGGPTSAGNLLPLCRRHHRAKDEAGWDLVHDPITGACTWTSPAGHSYTVEPPIQDSGAGPDLEPADWALPLVPRPEPHGAAGDRRAPVDLDDPPPF
ncbi:HNH endonuclease signature motif containing protein [Cryptosporangium minutisporangium]|uniref:HNH nuclease domain-containing protein n=1 Tax=Cryptosporangium minutisporangium TaxID=113569 RepID=A0ABP6SPR1_9ACTN